MSTKQKEQHFQELLEISKDLGNIEYDYILDLIQNKLRHFPIATCHVHKDIIIERARLNKGEIFKKESDISYLQDPDKIKAVLNKYGRGNRPFNPVFYGSMESEEMGLPRATALHEVRAFYLNPDKDYDGEVFTIGRWRTKSQLLCPEIIFCDEAIAANSYIREAFANQFAQISKHPEREYYLRLIKFYSEQFGANVPDSQNYNYKISAAISEMFSRKFPGIVFPSVASEFKGLNIMLRPDIVDQFLELVAVYTVEIFSRGKHYVINNHSHVTNIADKGAEFIYQEHSHPTRATKAEILKRFENI
jgi:hypothetical protein